jgi:F-box protein, helicase, 18
MSLVVRLKRSPPYSTLPSRMICGMDAGKHKAQPGGHGGGYSMELTEEQKRIVACNVGSGEILKVTALAGTGKTTTLVAYTRARPQLRFLYVAFNKSVQLEASAKFPKNVTCKTSHALAFPRFGSKYKDRLISGFKVNTVQDALGISLPESARFTIDTLNNYLVSADPKVAPHHIPPIARQHGWKQLRERPDFVSLANDLGRLMCNGENPEIGMPHDGYLKLYQLSRPMLNYDCILMDESQDLNPVTADYLLGQENTPKIVVGDPHQQIYSFRGARDFMREVNATQELYLTHSFRFNPKIAAVANMILARFKGETRRLVGLKSPGKMGKGEKVTIIARTNSKIFDEAVRLMRQKKKIGFVGGIEGYRLDRLKDAYFLYADRAQEISDPYIKSFDGFPTMERYAREAEDFEIAAMCRVAREYGNQIPSLVGALKECTVESGKADFLLTTAHKAKGLEWKCVQLANDFPALIEGGEIIPKDRLEPDEFNLIYVSMTRAMNSLRFADGCGIVPFILKYKEMLSSSSPVMKKHRP